MRAKQLSVDEEQTYAVVFDQGEEVVAGLTSWAAATGIRAARLTGIGGFGHVMLGFFDPAVMDYRRIPVEEQCEVLALVGDFAMSEDAEGPQLHAHVVVGLSDGAARGGHLLSGEVWPTLEVLVTQSPRYLLRRHDPHTGLALIDLDAGA
ncbi:DNA-binding protein [Nonomuraea sp. NN258]|uniref:PPC domain-containing DNA-binding protein n=1 Tax=Nonomuraea antri TaxID=2730852 RepID=UPI001568B573|nr:PPC domain-containing DNA-binding protein [Nonomuraea antri]NRQ38664.1 DNA-binding protein [Nonomuraea antri]